MVMGMINLLLAPVQRSFELSRRVGTSAARLSGSMMAPVTRPLMQMRDSTLATVRLGPALAMGAYEQLEQHVPRSIAQQLPARTAEVEALEARVARLEAAASKPRAAKATTGRRSAR